jgi:hypothetical protein
MSVDNRIRAGFVGRFRASKPPRQHQALCTFHPSSPKQAACKNPAGISLSWLRLGGLLARIHLTFTCLTALKSATCLFFIFVLGTISSIQTARADFPIIYSTDWRILEVSPPPIPAIYVGGFISPEDAWGSKPKPSEFF